MKNQNANSMNTFPNGKQTIGKPTNVPRQSSHLMKLFEDELMDLYWAEKAVTKAIPKMIKNATSRDLMTALTSHLAETGTQVTRLEQVFKSIDKKPIANKCEAMEGIIKEGGELIEWCKAGAMRDAGIIAAGNKVEHYEMATYGTLHQYAKTLGLTQAVSLLEATLNEEKMADKKLSEIAQTINVEAAKEDSDTMVETSRRK